jgi:superfamily II DNA or RNA helicase
MPDEATIQVGDRIRIEPFDEEGEVYKFEDYGSGVAIGVIFRPSNRAETLILSHEELARRVKRVPALWQDFAAGALPRDAFLLFVDALRLRLAHTFDPYYAVSVTQVDLLPHQVDAVYQHILPMPCVRFLLADDPGLGKTIMAGLVLKELKARGMVRRVLLVVPAHLQDQWQREMNDWFREDFVPLRRDVLNSIYTADFFERNPQVLISMDLARREQVRDLLARQSWDLVVVDEAHKFSATRYGRKIEKTKRYQLAEALAKRTKHMLFLTATPHKGDDDAYFLLLSLLEPRLFANPTQLKRAAQAGGLPFVLRRSKEQVTDLQGRPLFRRREVKTVSIELTDAEKQLYDAVTAYVRRWYQAVSDRTDRRSRNVALALTVLQRRLSSSLFAVRESLHRRKSKLQHLKREWERRLQEEELPEWDADAQQDLIEMTASEWESFQERLEGITAAQSPEELQEEIDELEELIQLALAAEKAGEEAKAQQLRQLVKSHLRHHPDEKLLIFTEFKDTLSALHRRFQEWGFPCALIHGEMNLQTRIEQEQYFRDEVQVMVATDAAGEGLNLQFCRLMLNYDLPWNPNRLEQRMGRIHRYGQKQDCCVFNMLYPETREGHVLQRLMEKLERMRERLGDTVYDVLGVLLEGVRLEELIMQAVLNAQQPHLERVLDEDLEARVETFRRTLEENALATHHIDLSAVQTDAAASRMRRLVPWDVERFTRLAVRTVGGQFTEDPRSPKVFRISLPREFLKQYRLSTDAFAKGARVAFERQVARAAHAEFFAPGHPVLDALIDHFRTRHRPARAVLMDEQGRYGALWLYRARLTDGLGNPVLERLVALFHDFASNETREVDPRMLWELEPCPHDAPLPHNLPDPLQRASAHAQQTALQHLNTLESEANARREREYTIKKRWLEESYKQLMQESQDKLFEYHRRRAAGEDMDAAIRQEEQNFKELVQEHRQRMATLEQERYIQSLEPELEAVALIVPQSLVQATGVSPDAAPESALTPDEAAKRQVEAAGMHAAMDYERRHARQPEDVSNQFLGYDILSRGIDETRYIEVKAFATTGAVTLTPHEWQMAERLQDAYWLYIVENALAEPTLHTIRNPASRLQAQPITGVIKVVIEDWKEAVQG